VLSQMTMKNFADTEGLTYMGGGTYALSEERLGRAYKFTYVAGGKFPNHDDPPRWSRWLQGSCPEVDCADAQSFNVKVAFFIRLQRAISLPIFHFATEPNGAFQSHELRLANFISTIVQMPSLSVWTRPWPRQAP